MKYPKKLTGSQLKLIAMGSMFVDHFAAVVLLALVQTAFSLPQGSVPTSHWISRLLYWALRNQGALIGLYDTLRCIGRFAFPVYCFLLMEGFIHTRSVPKYALRLAAFCLLSEIPFDLAFNGAILEFGYNNVFFTLLTGLLCIWAISEGGKILQSGNISQSVRLTLQVLLVIASAGWGCFMAEYVFRCDYAAAGVLAIMIMYLLRKWPAIAFTAAVGVLSIDAPIELYALIMVIPIQCYNGQRGRPMRIGPYIFYPAHLLVFYVLTLLFQ